MTDHDLIKKFEDRDESALTLTKESYGRYIKTILGRMLDSAEDAEECENDTYLQLWNSIPPARPVSLKAFIAKLCRNMGLKKIEKSQAIKRTAVIEVYDELEDSIISGKETPEEAFDAKELSSEINSFLKGKKTWQQTIFVKRYWYYMEISEISRDLGVSESKVKTTLYRLRNELAQYLRQSGFEVNV